MQTDEKGKASTDPPWQADYLKAAYYSALFLLALWVNSTACRKLATVSEKPEKSDPQHGTRRALESRFFFYAVVGCSNKNIINLNYGLKVVCC